MSTTTTTNDTKAGFWAKTWQVLRALDDAVDYDPLDALRRRMDLLENKLKEQAVNNPADHGEQS
jgi:hypothetical protein